jgi:serine/threonine protein kinase
LAPFRQRHLRKLKAACRKNAAPELMLDPNEFRDTLQLDHSGPFVNPGTRIGGYEIVTRIGAGGMGEVYRARDLKLQRDVAIKILPPAFAADADRLTRFEREARLLASLNHPHIGAIYGLETVASGTPGATTSAPALVLEFIDGESLDQRIARWNASSTAADRVREALDIARQIADALDAAHERGVIHRDLKPANVRMTNEGTAKVLDFGLSKAARDSDAASNADLAHSPTVTVHATEVGVILGTAAYMSPEQARGRVVDKRTDIWSFGCVLYEMLTGSAPSTARPRRTSLPRFLAVNPTSPGCR